jgi:hypothetical protein
LRLRNGVEGCYLAVIKSGRFAIVLQAHVFRLDTVELRKSGDS